MKTTVSDYVFSRVAAEGVKDIFMVSGGGIMFLCEALGKNKELKYWCNYNEQACAIAAEAYSRTTENIGVCLVTTGPGSTNALSGVAGAWVDSIPLLVISGQVRTGVLADYKTQRQVGPQEINIIPMAKPVTKYAITVMDPLSIRYELEKALYLAQNGRPGPAWINIPLDIQSSLIETDELVGYVPSSNLCPSLINTDISKVIEQLYKATRPVIIGGSGIILAHARKTFQSIVHRTEIPTLLTMSAMDLLDENDPLFQGRLGPAGQRRANFALQNADLVLGLGASLSISSLGFAQGVAPHAYKILVNIDAGDLDKKNISIDHKVLTDVDTFMKKLMAEINTAKIKISHCWKKTCTMWKEKYPPSLPHQLRQKCCVDMFSFSEELSQQMDKTDILVGGNSHDGGLIQFQNHKFKSQQRSLINFCYGAMGWDLPALVGACVASPNRRSILTTGDGSIMFNIHELLFLGFHKCNAKIFISNNDGYMGIIKTQDRFFKGNYVAATKKSGVANPNFKALAKAFGLKYIFLENNEQIREAISKIFSDTEPWICEIKTSQNQQYFKVGSYQKEDGSLASRSLEDMTPLLPPEEIEENMNIFN
ncbi:thiamine pyrophosphate-binding protein [Desulfobaculum bizertense]|uniref:Acetolactate synthase-1/2/3 large subunit n=1 Tax=Desulfobaculum bizertense DSM 18034 TaxID=1121442 RepID=A0A1T4WZT5_9BACT|nr:thiamine pyrophosphate-binding protein [Desulfobaculum bizertense]SKA82388.1 acetolactate synthase-1/2/3 large subunit [Desulfobaculum bizertense DSM 18034]